MYHLPRAAGSRERHRGDRLGDVEIDSETGSSGEPFARTEGRQPRENVNAHTDLFVANGNLCGLTNHQVERWSGNAQWVPTDERVEARTTLPSESQPMRVEPSQVLMRLRLGELDRGNKTT